MNNKRNIFLFPLLAGVIARLAALPFLDTSKDVLMEYGTIARNMLSGFGFSFSWLHSDGRAVILPSAYMPPGQVFIDFALLGLFGDSRTGLIALYIFQIAQACGFIYFTGKIARFIFRSEKATMATLWIAALYPTFIYTTLSFGVTSSALLFNAFAIYMAIRFSESLVEAKNALKFSLLFGLSCGLLLLTRGESPLVIVGTLILICYQNRLTFRRSFKYIGIAALVSAAILAPWTIRNYILFDRIIPISTNGGLNFWRGNNSLSNGSPYNEIGHPLWSTDEIWTELEPYLDKKGDYEKISSDIHIREAMKWIKENPSKFILLSLKKGAILWTFDLRSQLGGTAAYIAFYGCTLAALLNGIYFIRKNKMYARNEKGHAALNMIILWCICTTIIGMIILPLQRFQVLLIGIYLPVIGYGIAEIFQKKDAIIHSEETVSPIVP